MKIDCVCIIDDDHIYQFTALKTLKNIDASDNIIIFSNGKEAITYLADNKDEPSKIPDLIFLDLNMPSMDGWEFLEEYSKLKDILPPDKRVHIYIVSSSVLETDIERAKQFPEVSGYLVKPMTKTVYQTVFKEMQKASY